MPTVETYYNITEKKDKLSELYQKSRDSTFFVVPSGLDKDVLLKLISNEGSFFGERPRILIWSDLYTEIARLSERKQRRVIDPPDHDLIVSYILNVFIEEMVEAKKSLPQGVYHGSFSEILGENIRDLLTEDISPDDMRERLFKENDPPETSPEYILLRLYSDYIGYLEENNIADNAQIASLTRECLLSESARSAVSVNSFVFVGFLTFTGSQLKLIKTLNDISKNTFLLPETGLDGFHDSIRQLGTEYKERPHWHSKVFEIQASDYQLQFDAVARETALWVHGSSSLSKLGEIRDYGDIGIMVTPQHLCLMENALARYKIPCNVQVRGCIADTLTGELPKLIWNAFTSGWDTQSTAFLLSNPLLKSSDFDLAASVSCFPEGSRSWKGILKGKSLDTFGKVESLCFKLSNGGTPSEILKFWQDFIESLDLRNAIGKYIELTPELDGVLKDISSSIKELEKKIEILDDISKEIGPASKISLKGHDALRYITEWGENATLPIQLPQSRSVTVYAGIPPVLTVHRYWIMTDVDYNTWPGKLRESPLLDNNNKIRFNESVQQDEKADHRPHIPDLHEKREQKEALFRRLIATALGGCVITHSLTDQSGRPLGPSQFVAPLFNSKNGPGKWEGVGSIQYKPSDALPPDGSLWFCGAEIPISANKTDRGEFPRKGKTDESSLFSVSLSQLDEWKSCPYRYWCKKNLKLPDHDPQIYNNLKAGSLLHSLWENSWKEYIDSPRSFSMITKREWEKASHAFYPELLRDPRLTRYAENLKKQISSVADLLDSIESSALIKSRSAVMLEYKLPEYEVEGVSFKGRADRLDLYGDGFVVIDYKSNRSSDHRSELQLAAYSVVISKKTGYKPAGYGWIGHKDASFYGYFNSKELSEAYCSSCPRKSLDDYLELAEETMTEMAKSIKKGEFAANYESDSCRYCEFFVICRRREAYIEETEHEEEREVRAYDISEERLS